MSDNTLPSDQAHAHATPANEEDVLIFVDREGDWFYGNRPIIRKEILETFYQCLRLTRDGRYVLEWQGRLYPIAVADTPFVITRVDHLTDEFGRAQIQLTFKHLSETEILDPSTLWVGPENVLYCRVRQSRFPARFSRPAYYQVAQWIEPVDHARFALRLGDGLYPIAQPPDDAAAAPSRL
ncbi:DUF1285 domain-containing protein [Desulfosoma caldarium]|uniref:DUF1285 domain-containing protein n=1 Tax=Desulfosoma caldarium TaxID=610254 RepID=A0A3N1UQC6_9BACT|nr:DUF1285 domain-containing protein [Desulfosoma caldarium]ROQ90920.1 hypothetical protein EDC27_2189 [Desulfosoma caldarium]